MIKNCPNCKKDFEVNERRKRQRERIYCSTSCARYSNGKNNKGKKHSEETRAKMSEAQKGENNNFFGKKHSIDSKNKMAESTIKSAEKRVKSAPITKYEYDCLDGMILADASISDGSTFASRLTYGCKYKETLDLIKEDLQNIEINNIWEYTSKPHKKTGKCYTSWYLKSRNFKELKTLRERWYPEGIKIVPSDIKLNRDVCFWWFIGDGYTNKGNVLFCTDSFTEEGINILIKELKRLNFNSWMRKGNRIILDRESSIRFLDWVVEFREIPAHYKYKWDNFNKFLNG